MVPKPDTVQTPSLYLRCIKTSSISSQSKTRKLPPSCKRTNKWLNSHLTLMDFFVGQRAVVLTIGEKSEMKPRDEELSVYGNSCVRPTDNINIRKQTQSMGLLHESKHKEEILFSSKIHGLKNMNFLHQIRCSLTMFEFRHFLFFSTIQFSSSLLLFSIVASVHIYSQPKSVLLYLINKMDCFWSFLEWRRKNHLNDE